MKRCGWFFAVSFLHPHQSLQLVLHPAIKLLVLIEVPGKSTVMGSSQHAASTTEVGHTLLAMLPWPWVSETGHILGPLRELAESPSPADVHLAAEMKTGTLCCRYRVKLQLVPLKRSILPL